MLFWSFPQEEKENIFLSSGKTNSSNQSWSFNDLQKTLPNLQACQPQSTKELWTRSHQDQAFFPLEFWSLMNLYLEGFRSDKEK